MQMNWIDELAMGPKGTPCVRNSFKATIPRNPEYQPTGGDPYENMPMVNDRHPEMFKMR